MSYREDRAAARGPEKTANSPEGSSPAALHELGLQHTQAGRHLDAQLCCEQVLAMDPHHVDSLHLMGLLSLQAGQYDHAIEWIARANRQDPKAQFLVSLGIALTQRGLHAEAFKALDAAVEVTPGDGEAWLHHGNAFADADRSGATRQAQTSGRAGACLT